MPETSASPVGVALQQPGADAALDRLLARVDALTTALESVMPLAQQAPNVIAGITDAADEAYARAAASGVDLDARLHDLMGLAEKLTEPRTMAVLSGLLDRVDQLEKLLVLADQAPAFMAMMVDSLDEMAERARSKGIDFEQAVAGGAGAAVRLGSMMGPAELDALEGLLRSGVLQPETVRLVGGLGEALTSSASTEVPRVGPFGLLRALRDPDAQRALGFAAVFARQLGRRLDGGAPSTSPAAPAASPH